MFDCVQDKVVERHSQRIYVWDTARAMQAGELPICKDPEWWVAAWRGPAKLTVDMGRSADAAIKLRQAGLLSFNRYYEERCQDARDEWAQQIQDLVWLKGRCIEAGVDIREIIGTGPTTILQLPQPEPAP